MARIKKSIPKDVLRAQKRTDGMNSIEDKLDLGSGVSTVTIDAAIKKVTDKISLYNIKLSELDQLDNEIGDDVKALNDLSSRALKGVEFKYGKDSSEYEMVGGTRTSERKKSKKKDDDDDGDAPTS